MSARTAEDEARATARARKDAAQRADADAVWKQVRKEEQTLLDRTAKLRELRLEREAQEAADRKAAEAAAARKAKAAAPKAKRARVSTGG